MPAFKELASCGTGEYLKKAALNGLIIHDLTAALRSSAVHCHKKEKMKRRGLGRWICYDMRDCVVMKMECNDSKYEDMAVTGVSIIVSQTLFAFLFSLCKNYYYKTVQVLCSALRRLLLNLSDFILVEGPATDTERRKNVLYVIQRAC